MVWWFVFVRLVVMTDVGGQISSSNCTSNPCRNGAVCENTASGYQCYCVDGYAGPNCEINYDDCSSFPCLNNATCVDDVAAYRCICQSGFTGENCQTNLDDCILSPCLRNGTCIDLIDGYICECPLPFRGDDCSLMPCETSPCENGATCYDDILFNFTKKGYFCECVFGFEGIHCEVNIDDCNSTACSGRGICVDGIRDYSCLCEPGFDGEDCQLPINDCIGNECRNNATCHDLHLGYWCNCTVPGYEGLLCERERDECTSWKPCQNGASCVDEFNGYRCLCTENWTGKNCTEKVNRCLQNPCLNNAGCLDTADSFLCHCQPFYTGSLCETEFNPCATEYSPCQNEAECIVPPDGQYICFCQDGFTGQNCEVDVNECLSAPCYNNATCEDAIADYICHCLTGWTGHRCEANIDDCVTEPCLNGATCVDLVNRFRCDCAEHYTGHLCEDLVDYCHSNPCNHDSSCRLVFGGYKCHCLPPYTGLQCLDLINACESKPCQHNGSCVNLSPGYYCNCVSPYTGSNCESKISFCASEPCLNDGLCQETLSGFICICPPLLTGKQCTDLIDYCDKRPCKNDGICLNSHFTYRCICAYGFQGVNCTVMVDFCSDSPCQNLGNCTNIRGGFRCECPSAYSGKICESVLPLLLTSIYPVLSTSSFSMDISTSLFMVASSFPTSLTLSLSSQIFSSLWSKISVDSSKQIINASSSSLSSSVLHVIESSTISLLKQNNTDIFSLFNDSKTLTDLHSLSAAETPYKDFSTHISAVLLTKSLEESSNSFSSYFFQPTTSIYTSVKTDSASPPEKSHQTFTYLPVNSESLPSLNSFTTVSLLATIQGSKDSESIKSLNSLLKTSADTLVVLSSNFSLTVMPRSSISVSPLSSVSVFKLTASHSVLNVSSAYESTTGPDSFSVTSDEVQSSIPPFVQSTFHYQTSMAGSSKFTTSFGNSVSDLGTSDALRIISTSITQDMKSDVLTSLQSAKLPSSVISDILYSFVSISVASDIQYHSVSEIATSLCSNSAIISETSIDSVLFLSAAQTENLGLVTDKNSKVGIASSIKETRYIVSETTPGSSDPHVLSSRLFSGLPLSKLITNSGQKSSTYRLNVSYISMEETSRYEIESFSSDYSLHFETDSLLATSRYFIDHNDNSLSSASSSNAIAFSNLSETANISISSVILDSNLSSDYQSFTHHTSLHQMDTVSPLFSGVKYSHTLIHTFIQSSNMNKTSELVLSSSLSAASFGLEHTSLKIEPTPSYKTASSSVMETELLSRGTAKAFSGVNEKLLSSDFKFSAQSSSVIITSLLPHVSLHSRFTPVIITAAEGSYSELLPSSYQSMDDMVSRWKDIRSERTVISAFALSPSLKSVLSTSSIVKSSVKIQDDSRTILGLSTSDSIVSSSVLKETSALSEVPLQLISTPLLSASVSETLTSYLFARSVFKASVNDSFTTTASFMWALSSLPLTDTLFSELDIQSDSGFVILSNSTLIANPSEMSTVLRSSASDIDSVVSSSVLKETSALSEVPLQLISTPRLSASVSETLTSYLFARSVSKASASVYTMSEFLSDSWFPPSNMKMTTETLLVSNESFATPESFMWVLSSLPLTDTLFSELDMRSYSGSVIRSNSTPVVNPSDISTIILSTTSMSSLLTTLRYSQLLSASSHLQSTVQPLETELSETSLSTSTKVVTKSSSIRKFEVSSSAAASTSTVIVSTETPDSLCGTVDCYNGGVCRVIGSSAFCDCPHRFMGPRCETALTMPLSLFNGRTLLEIAGMDVIDSLVIQISFQTSQDFGTLLYYQLQANQSSSTSSLQIVEGMLQFQFVCASQSFLLDTRYRVNNAELYFVVVRQTQLCQATLDLVDLVVQHPLTWIIGTNKLLQIDHMTEIQKFMIGGLSMDVASEYDRNFTGCIGDVWVNGFPLWVNDSLNEVNLHECETTIHPELCSHVNCLNGGQCHVTMVTVGILSTTCDCMIPYTGKQCETEILVYYPSFGGTSFLKYAPPQFLSSQSNEIYLTVRPQEADGTLLISANQDSGNIQKSFIYLYLEDGMIQYRFSCDGQAEGKVNTRKKVVLNEAQEIIIRQSWTSSPGQWCSAAVLVNSVIYVSQQFLSVKQSHLLGDLYIGGTPRNSSLLLNIPESKNKGFVGCVRNLQVNGLEHDLVTMATEGVNIGNCDIPVCEHNPCENGATCHSSGEDWFCDCVPGYSGRLCSDRLCTSNVCQHGGTCVVLDSQDDQLCMCPFGRGGVICEEAVTVSVPHFSGTQYGHSSFMAYENLVGMRDEFEIKFSFILANDSYTDSSLMLLMRSSASIPESDYMVLGLYKGHMLFRFNLGSGEASIWSPKPLDTSIPHHFVQFGHHGREGWVKVDTQPTGTGRSPGALTALNTDHVLFVGGADADILQFLPLQAKFDNGFRGCIYNLEVSMGGGNFFAPGFPPGLADYGRNVRQCSSLSCSDSSGPCQNGARCIEIGASIYCNCSDGWKGLLCAERMTACDTGHSCVEEATCLPRTAGGYECLCPLGKAGRSCSEDITISDPSFVGEKTYMSFTPVYIKHKTDIKLEIKPTVLNGLVYYVARQLHSYSGDFLSLVLHAGKLEMRYHHGDKLNVITSNVVMRTNSEIWYKIEAGRNTTHGYLSVNGHMTLAMTTGMMSYLDTATDFYLGGVPDLDLVNPSAVPSEPSAFQGCVREFSVNGKNYQLNKEGAIEGRNIVDCDGTPCGYSVCANGGTCTTTSETPGFTCTCPVHHYGDRCEHPIECRDLNCHNFGVCRQLTTGSYQCSCLIGWSGPSCETTVAISTSVQLGRNSYVYYVDPYYKTSNKTYTHLSLTFKTTQLNGLLLWNGQSYSDEDDYLGLGLKDGRIQLVFNLGWYSRSEILTPNKYSDGKWHSIDIKRHAGALILVINGVEWLNKVPGDFTDLDTHGHYYIGGFVECSLFSRTLEFFKDTFQGCIKDVQIQGSESVNFLHAAGENILSC